MRAAPGPCRARQAQYGTRAAGLAPGCGERRRPAQAFRAPAGSGQAASGCSTGFGRELALAELARGWHCVATARNQAVLEDLAPEAGECLLRVTLDVNDPARVDAAAKAVYAQFQLQGDAVRIRPWVERTA
ncbi:SDR family NAD(P)-dependent oxidoreductase [Paraburkholderia acidipaludis]|uniref:SDR family NAD(P)-dependent oxidoreductase n=1 Tax=Paraburkholderia acidipaludis TaxID=660537 RepID=UPI000AF97025|nr:SDR family NAD(P)-dependent oxidoreductase [Paraburkholderia acidipaludis]